MWWVDALNGVECIFKTPLADLWHEEVHGIQPPRLAQKAVLTRMGFTAWGLGFSGPNLGLGI